MLPSCNNRQEINLYNRSDFHRQRVLAKDESSRGAGAMSKQTAWYEEEERIKPGIKYVMISNDEYDFLEDALQEMMISPLVVVCMPRCV